MGLVDRPRMRGVRLVDRARVEPKKRGVVPDWTCGLSTRGGISTRGLSLRGAFKTRSFFRIGLA